jgi:hypothetical protein
MAEEANPPVVNAAENETTASRPEENVEAAVKEVVKESANGTVSNGKLEVETSSREVATGDAPIKNQGNDCFSLFRFQIHNPPIR